MAAPADGHSTMTKMRAAYIVTIFLGAGLLFLVQPMVGKLLLPLLGGTPAVWNTCMVFFQAALLAGYAYAHLLTKIDRPLWQIILHGLVLAAALVALPIAVRAAEAAPADAPIAWLLVTLTLSVGLPFFVVSTSAPLLQRWFSRTDDAAAGDPYFLYAASNAGSLLALLGYPLLVEPLLGLDAQRTVWSIGYGLFAVLTIGCGAIVIGRGRTAMAEVAETEPAQQPSRRDYMKWIVLAFVPSSLMLGATQHITTDVAAVPLFWVVPLAIYLLTFILAFSRRQIIGADHASKLLVMVGLPALLFSVAWSRFPVALILSLHLVLLFAAAAMCHGRLADARPHPRHLTAFYLAIAVGGSLGGVFNALVAPLIFDTVLEYPLMLAVALLLRRRLVVDGMDLPWRQWLRRGLDVGIVAVTVISIPFHGWVVGLTVLERERSFFGVHRVGLDEANQMMAYYQGTTLHGMQMETDPRRPVGYYHDETGIGQLYLRLAGDPRLDRVGLVGLGTGALAARIEAGQHHTFYEIDPAVVRIAQDADLFTYLRDVPQSPTIVLGDGRQSLVREPDGEFGLLVIDAFSSDAIPVHLLTTEAMDLYFSKLAPDGLLALNITNRHLDLAWLVMGLARDRDLVAAEWLGALTVETVFEEGKLPARWLVLARDYQALAPLRADPLWRPLPASEDAPVWTDDFSNMLAVIDWWP
ncbi:MAG: spermidine synthase [Planctomycetota bacterium]